MQKNILVLGAGGFIGGHLVKKLKQQGHWVRGVDIKDPDFVPTEADQFFHLDLRDRHSVRKAMQSPASQPFDEVYQLAADMGGAGYVFTGEHDAAVMHNSAMINLNVAHACIKNDIPKVFYTSSACIYPEYNQMDPDNPNCEESSAYPADPDSEYGWEKLFSERMYMAYARNYNLPVRIARLHNVFGPNGTWVGGREKAPAAMCRKVAEASHHVGDFIDVWGDGKQTRSFLYIDECIDAMIALMASSYSRPVNIGSEEMIAINDLARMVIDISGKIKLRINNVSGPLGVMGRNSNNTLLRNVIGWAPTQPLEIGMRKTYRWIEDQVRHAAQ